MDGRNIGFTRWYDTQPQLSQAVRLLEKAPAPHRQLIARAIIGDFALHEVPQHTEGLKKLGTEKVMGLMKSMVKRRWYDQDPMVHRAFNHLYLMSEEMRQEIGIKILITLKALEGLGATSGTTLLKGEVDSIYKLITSIFNKPLPYLLGRTEFIVEKNGRMSHVSVTVEISTEDDTHIEVADDAPPLPRLKGAVAPGTEKPEKTQKPTQQADEPEAPLPSLSSTIKSDSEDGMKVTRLT